MERPRAIESFRSFLLVVGIFRALPNTHHGIEAMPPFKLMAHSISPIHLNFMLSMRGARCDGLLFFTGCSGGSDCGESDRRRRREKGIKVVICNRTTRQFTALFEVLDDAKDQPDDRPDTITIRMQGLEMQTRERT